VVSSISDCTTSQPDRLGGSEVCRSFACENRRLQSNLDGWPILINPRTHNPDFSPQTSDRHSLILADQQPGTSVRLGHNNSPTIYLQLAVQVLVEHDLVPPEPEQLNRIVRSALAVQCLYFAACLYHPDKAELHHVFEAFVLRCVASDREKENLCPTLKYD
jgi:hypothetical protein